MTRVLTYADSVADLNGTPRPGAVVAPPVPEPSDPMDWPLPCDVKVGHGTHSKGVALRSLVLRMKALYKMATGEDADEVAGRTVEQRQAMSSLLIGGCPSCGRADCVARACCNPVPDINKLLSAAPTEATHTQPASEPDKLADRSLAKSFRENPREASLADQAGMSRAIQDPLTNRAFNLDGCAQPASEPVAHAMTGPMCKRVVQDAIRSAYDTGYNDSRRVSAKPGDSAPGYRGRDVEADHGGALIARLSTLLAATPQPAAKPRPQFINHYLLTRQPAQEPTE